MKAKPEPRDEAVDELLGQWVVNEPLPPRFQELVWQRIARNETRAEAGLRARLTSWLAFVLHQPKVACSYVAALLVVGVAAGSVAAQWKANRLDAALKSRYVQSLDPYVGGSTHL